MVGKIPGDDFLRSYVLAKENKLKFFVWFLKQAITKITKVCNYYLNILILHMYSLMLSLHVLGNKNIKK